MTVPVAVGYEDECGAGKASDYNVNLPMPHGSSEAVFFEQVDEALLHIARRF